MNESTRSSYYDIQTVFETKLRLFGFWQSITEAMVIVLLKLNGYCVNFYYVVIRTQI